MTTTPLGCGDPSGVTMAWEDLKPPTASPRQTCPRCNRPVNLRPDGRLKSHSKPTGGRCLGGSRFPENAAMRVSPLKVLGLQGRLTSKERWLLRGDAVRASGAIEELTYDYRTVGIRFTGGSRSYSWDCRAGGWALLWKMYRVTARENDGRFSLGRAVNRWREMPSIKRAASERQRQELAEDSPHLMQRLRDSLEVVVDPFALDLASEEQIAGEFD